VPTGQWLNINTIIQDRRSGLSYSEPGYDPAECESKIQSGAILSILQAQAIILQPEAIDP
jgi:hypothetical protein